MNEIIQQNKKTVAQFLFILGIGVLLLILAVILMTVRKTAYIGSASDERATISVSGVGKLDKIPDTARISFTMSDTQKTLSAAQKNVSDRIQSLTEALSGAGIEKEKITTQNYTSYPKYEYSQIRCFDGMCPPSNPTLVGYTLSHSVTVNVEDLEKVEQVLGIIGGYTVENISGPSFGFSDEEGIAREVRALAIENAEKEARALARDLGVRLVRVISYSDQSGGGVYDMTLRTASAMTSLAEEKSPTLPIGEQNLEKTVLVTYEIR